MALENRLDVFVHAINDRYCGISGMPNLLMAVTVVWKKREIIARHTATCVYKASTIAFERWGWFQRFPMACTTCDSHGWIGDDPCHCLQAGCCPRCGEQLHYDVATFNEWLDKGHPCPFCGWSHGKQADDYPPVAHQCYCWEGIRLYSGGLG